MLEQHPEVIQELARNEAKHVYKETPEEKLVVAYRSFVQAAAISEEALEEARKKQLSMVVGLSAYKAMYDCEDIVDFYTTLFRINDNFCNLSCVQLTWANRNLRVAHGGVSDLSIVQGS
jgi:hypothetical protein